MTVAELIKELEKQPQDAPVHILQSELMEIYISYSNGIVNLS